MDAATNEVLETIKVDGVVHNVQVSPDGKMLGIKTKFQTESV